MKVILPLLLLCCSCGIAPPVEIAPTLFPQDMPPCGMTLEEMPPTWHPTGRVHQWLNQEPWSTAEAQDASRAAHKALDELIVFFETHPTSVHTLDVNAVQCFLDFSYAASNMPELRIRALTAARKNLAELLIPYLQRDPSSATCDEFLDLLDYTAYSGGAYPAGDERLSKMVSLTNAAAADCGSLQAALDYDYHRTLDIEHFYSNQFRDLVLWSTIQIVTGRDFRRILDADREHIEELFDLVLWSVTITDARRLPGLQLPDGARELMPKLWHFLSRYPFVDAQVYFRKTHDHTFYDTAYLATHIGYVPTGFGRHPIHVEDAPWLFRFLRENFYAVLDMGELDMIAEFIDLFRQYGCTEKNDRQVRDGTRYLLRLYHASGDSWIAYRRSPAENPNDYDLIHKPWTGGGGVRARIMEPPVEGTYGSIFRRAFNRSR
jgi:hypothetical protein